MASAIKLFQSASSGLIVAIDQPGVNLLIVWEDFRTLRGRFGLFHDAPSRGKSHTMCKFSPTQRANLHSCIFIGERRPARGRPGRPRLISRRVLWKNGTIQLSFIRFVFVKERTP